MSTTAANNPEPGNAGQYERRQCCDCSAPFAVSEAELRWLEARGLQPFRRCAACRRARRQAEDRRQGHPGLPPLTYR